MSHEAKLVIDKLQFKLFRSSMIWIITLTFFVFLCLLCVMALCVFDLDRPGSDDVDATILCADEGFINALVNVCGICAV
jgi:hypothetical protein